MLALISFFNVLGAIFVEAYAMRLLRRGRIGALPLPDFGHSSTSKGTTP